MEFVLPLAEINYIKKKMDLANLVICHVLNVLDMNQPIVLQEIVQMDTLNQKTQEETQFANSQLRLHKSNVQKELIMMIAAIPLANVKTQNTICNQLLLLAHKFYHAFLLFHQMLMLLHQDFIKTVTIITNVLCSMDYCYVKYAWDQENLIAKLVFPDIIKIPIRNVLHA